MSAITMCLPADDVSIQSIRALKKHVETRGEEPLKDTLYAIAVWLEQGFDLTITAGDL